MYFSEKSRGVFNDISLLLPGLLACCSLTIRRSFSLNLYWIKAVLFSAFLRSSWITFGSCHFFYLQHVWHVQKRFKNSDPRMQWWYSIFQISFINSILQHRTNVGTSSYKWTHLSSINSSFPFTYFSTVKHAILRTCL